MNRKELKEFICDCFWFVVLVIFAIWLYFAMVANAPAETPETPKEQTITEQAKIKRRRKERQEQLAITLENGVQYKINMKG